MLLARFFFQWIIRFSDQGKDLGAPLFSATLVGFTLLLFRVVDAVTDPAVGALSDTWVRSGKQRRSLLWFSFFLPPLGAALVFAPNLTMNEGLRWTFLALGMFVFFLGYTLYAIPYWSLLDDYGTGDPSLRTRLSNSLGANLLLATGIGFVASPFLVERIGFFSTALWLSGISLVLLVLPYFGAPRNLATVPPTESHSLSVGLRAAFSDRKFLATILLFSGGQMSFTVMTTASPFLVEKLLGGTLGDVALILGPFLLTAIPTFFLVPMVTRRLGSERTAFLATMVLAVAYSGSAFLGQGIILSPMGTAMVVFACAGPAAAFLLGLEGEAIALAAEQSPSRSTSLYFGIYNFAVKSLNGVAVFLSTLLLATDSVLAIRCLPAMAGCFCLAGGLLYLRLKPPAQLGKAP